MNILVGLVAVELTVVSLKTRFNQTQEDVAYLTLALIPDLSKEVLDEMDIDSLTRELQELASQRKPPPPSPSPLLSEMSSSLELLQESSDSGSVAASDSSTSYSAVMTSSSSGWVEASNPAPSVSSLDPSMSITSSISSEEVDQVTHSLPRAACVLTHSEGNVGIFNFFYELSQVQGRIMESSQDIELVFPCILGRQHS